MREERRGGTYNVCVVSNLHPVYRGVLFGIRFNLLAKVIMWSY